MPPCEHWSFERKGRNPRVVKNSEQEVESGDVSIMPAPTIYEHPIAPGAFRWRNMITRVERHNLSDTARLGKSFDQIP